MKLLMFFVWLMFIIGVAMGQPHDSASDQSESDLAAQLDQTLTADSKNPSTLPATREYASENIEIRKFDPKKWREIVESHSYADTRTRKTPRGQEADGEAPQRTGPRESNNGDEGLYDYDEESNINLGWLGPVGQIMFYAAIAIFIVMILHQIIRSTAFRSTHKKLNSLSNSAEDIHDITELDTEDLIRKAHNANDYKLAIRLYFLDLLKKLHEIGMIAWTKDKTNRDYLSELFTKQYYFDEVRRLTAAYERVWYGEHIPTAERYHELKDEFQHISQKFKAS